jgi:putative ABC transport system permease protein
MHTFDVLSTAAGNLRRNKTRSTLTILAVLIGATTITLTNGIGSGIKQYLERQIGNLGADTALIVTKSGSDVDESDNDGPKKYDPTQVRAQSGGLSAPTPPGAPGGSNFLLTNADIDALKSLDGVTSAVPQLAISPDYIAAKDDKFEVTISATGGDIDLNYDLAAGEQVNSAANEFQAMLPSSYVVPLGYDSPDSAVGNTVIIALTNQLGEQKEYTAGIVGVVNNSLINSDALVINSSFKNALYDFQQTGAPEARKSSYQIAIIERNADMSEQQIVQLKDVLKEKGYAASTIRDQQALIFSIIDGIIAVLNAFGIVALAAASFGIINTLYMAVQERTKEIGLMKAVGMSRARIFALFSIEAAFLGLWGSGLGVLLAIGIGQLANQVTSQGILADFEGLQLLVFTPQSIAAVVGIIVVIAFLAGTLPARKASKLDPIEALRYE